VVDETQLFVMTGLAGKLGKYDWNLGYVHGDAKLDDELNNNVNNYRLSAALDAVTDSSGNVVCRATLTNPGQFPGCVPINVFGLGSESTQALDYVLATNRYVAKTKQDEASASIGGALFDTWVRRASLSADRVVGVCVLAPGDQSHAASPGETDRASDQE